VSRTAALPRSAIFQIANPATLTKKRKMEHNDHRIAYNWYDSQDDANDSASPNHPARLMRDDTVLFIWIVTAIVFASLFVICCAMWYLEWRFGIRCCPGGSRGQRGISGRDAFIASTQRRREAAIAAEREKKLDEKARKVEVERKRQLLIDVTITVEEDHLKQDQDTLQTLEEGTTDQQDDDDSTVALHIPGQRRTSAECRICLANFVVGDKIIHSPNPDCIHIFHDTCILSWLSESKAKSDCPCCRLAFIPEGYDDATVDKDQAANDTSNESSASAEGSTRTLPSSSNDSQSSSSDTDESEGFEEEEGEDSSV